MGLKFFSHLLLFSFLSPLKSDQNGVEIREVGRKLIKERKLKSDQNGVEIDVQLYRIYCNIALKSDQNGVEIVAALVGTGPVLVY